MESIIVREKRDQEVERQEVSVQRTIMKSPEMCTRQAVFATPQQQMQRQETTTARDICTELLAVNEMISLVDKEFQARDNELAVLTDGVQEREKELAYCENQTKKQADALGVLKSSISFRQLALDEAQRALLNFHNTTLAELTKHWEQQERQDQKVNDFLTNILEPDLNSLRRIDGGLYHDLAVATQRIDGLEDAYNKGKESLIKRVSEVDAMHAEAEDKKCIKE
jgi:hypothetical protein